MRTPWTPQFPRIVIHACWNGPGACLKAHPDYTAAKTRGDVEAADRLVRDLLQDEALDRIVDLFREETPIIASPALNYTTLNNVIPLMFARLCSLRR
jgi:hypothetical protein